MRKSKLFTQLNDLPTEELRQQINKIISESRSLPINIAKYKKYLRPNEVKSVFVFFGIEIPA